MNGKNPLLYHLLRILTPDELNELTTTSKGRNLVSLTKMLQKDISEGEIETEIEEEGAKILPFESKENTEESVQEEGMAFHVECGERCIVILDDHIKRITVLNSNYSKNCPITQETSSFIISEKIRFKDNYNRIKSKEVLSLYKKNASVDINREKSNKDDASKTSNIGVLVNKKQA